MSARYLSVVSGTKQNLINLAQSYPVLRHFNRHSVLFMVQCSRGYSSKHPTETIVMDVDTGIDDAMAILTVLGDPSVSVKAITCVRGNTDVETVVVNLHKTLAVAGRLEIPVYSGKNYGLVSSISSDNYFGEDGFGDLGSELHYDSKWASEVQKEHAAVFLARIVSENPGQITILALGPLTNIALALELNPDFLKQARKVVILGGSIRGAGNVAPGIEFNFFADPEAAHVVLDRAELSKTQVTVVPMETVTDCDLDLKWRDETMSNIKSKVTTFLDTLDTKHRLIHPWAAKFYTPYDTYAAVALLNPKSISRSLKVFGSVETSGLKTRGVLLIDYISLLQKDPNIEVILEMHKTEIRKTIVSNLSTFKD